MTDKPTAGRRPTDDNGHLLPVAHRLSMASPAAGVFERLWQEGLYAYDEAKGIDWEWQAMDGAMTKAPLGGETDWPQPD
jgi:hypothetical protein